MNNLHNKSVWICGASSGIGRSIAVALIELGANVIVSGRRIDELKKIDGALLYLSCDVKDSNDWQYCVDKVNSQFGSLDIFIYNSGICEYIDTSHFSSDVFERTIATNFLGLTKALEFTLPLLRKSTSPYFVGMSSSVSWFALPRAEAYGASKAAITYLLKSLRADLSSEGIDVSIILPGFVKTPLTDRNDFPMPFLISAEQAADRIIRGLEKRKLEIHFPRRFTWMLKLFSHLPAGVQHAIARRFVQK